MVEGVDDLAEHAERLVDRGGLGHARGVVAGKLPKFSDLRKMECESNSDLVVLRASEIDKVEFTRKSYTSVQYRVGLDT